MSADNVYQQWDSSTFNRRSVLALSELFCRSMPRPLLYAISDNIMEWYLGWRPETLRSLADNLTKAFPEIRRGRAEELASRTVINYGRGVVDYLHSQKEPPLVTTDPPSAVNLLRAPGGKILVTAHMGNWEVGGAYLGKTVGPFWLLGFPERDAGVEDFRRKRRDALGHRTLIVTGGLSTPFHIRRVLESGESAVVLVDRAIGRDSVEVLFRGRRARFLKSPAVLSYLTGCPLVPVAVMSDGPGVYTAYLGGSLVAGGDPRADMQKVADFFGTLLERYPDQWYNFFRYWREEP